MPTYDIPTSSVDFTRRAILVDTNVLVKAFGDEPDSAEVLWALNEMHVQWLIPVSVIVETWGLLVGRDGNQSAGLHMLAWTSTPGRAVVVGQLGETIPDTRELTARLGIDFVDAAIWLLASDITAKCDFSPPIHVATYDTRDYYRNHGRHSLRMSLYDMRTEFPSDPFESD